MTELLNAAAGSALEELLEVSPQIEAAVIITRESATVAAHAPAMPERAVQRFATTTKSLLEAAQQARTELGREPVVQVEVASQDGHVFVVADATHAIAAVTAADPTVGLVFYDLKTALRSVREARASTAPSASESGEASLVVPMGSSTPNHSADAPSSNGSAAPTVKTGRWRKKK